MAMIVSRKCAPPVWILKKKNKTKKKVIHSRRALQWIPFSPFLYYLVVVLSPLLEWVRTYNWGDIWYISYIPELFIFIFLRREWVSFTTRVKMRTRACVRMHMGYPTARFAGERGSLDALECGVPLFLYYRSQTN